MAAPKEDPVKTIINSPLKDVIVKGFAEVFRVKPDFPVEFLGRWLKNYSQNEARRKQLEASRSQKEEQVAEMQRDVLSRAKEVDEIKNKKLSIQVQEVSKFTGQVKQTKYLSDLLTEYLPETIEKFCHSRGAQLTGCYIGELTHRHKKLEENNFQPGAEYDTENPKVIEYIGASKSHKFMMGQILPNQAGRTYQIFKEQEPAAEEEQGKPAKIKKKFLYVPFVQKDEKIYFFRFPKLGSFACFPLKIKSCLFTESFDKGIGDYKAFVKNKEEIEKEYNEKLTEARGVFEEAKRKFEEHEVNQEDANSHTDHAVLQEQLNKAQQALKQVEKNSPVIEAFHYQTKQKEFVVGLDTMGKDAEIPETVLNFIEEKIDFFRQEWEEKEYKMLLGDILQFIEDEPSLQAQDNYFKEQERGIISANQGSIKQQYPNRQKQPEFELTVLKVGRLLKLLRQPAYVNSLKAYLAYSIPKYKQIIQIVSMLLGYSKADINLPRSNVLNGRKCLTKQNIQKILKDLQKYELRRQSSEAVSGEYKINKLLERLQKIDGEAVGKYNSWLYALLITAKSICWARIQCRDAKIEAHEAKIKAMNQRQAEIVKYNQQLQKAMEAAKAEVTEQMPPFSEEQWLKTYTSDNTRPEKLVVEELKSFLDIE